MDSNDFYNDMKGSKDHNSQKYSKSDNKQGNSQHEDWNDYDMDHCDDDYNWGTSSSFKKNSTNTYIITDDKCRRIISRNSLVNPWEPLYSNEDLDSLSDDVSNQKNTEYEAGFDWTQKNWQKAADNGGTSSTGRILKQNPRMNLKHNKIHKNLVAALAQPVKLSKAESMMQKMGWQGGALGKAGDGIIEPIAPNAAYATRNFGFGLQIEEPKRKFAVPKSQKRHKNKKKQKEIFRTNVLVTILEFVKNNQEIEIVFENNLKSNERFFIHGLVNDVINDNSEDSIHMDFDNLVQMDILNDIKNNILFFLGTTSEGEDPNRCLCLYKEAPDYMYLITPPDLHEEEEIEDEETEQNITEGEQETNQTSNNETSKGMEIENDENIITKGEQEIKHPKTDKIPKEIKKENNIAKEEQQENCTRDDETCKKMESESNENPFLKSILRNLDKDEQSTDDVIEKFKEHCRISTQENVEPDILRRLVEYFAEFVENEEYTEFRFLGPFNSEEIESINYFLRNYSELVKLLDDKQSILDDLADSGCCLHCTEENNESIVFYKYNENEE